MTQDNNMPAFPACNEANVNGTMGMTLRDYFAGQALAAMITKSTFFDMEGEYGKPVDLAQFKADMAVSAYYYADAMLEARK